MALCAEKRETFKTCVSCRTDWLTRDRFLSDSRLGLIGYQVAFDDLTKGQFLFNHHCGATLAVPVLEFRDLYDGPVFEASLTGTGPCPGYCLRKEELDSCPAECECAFVRQIIQILKKWPKTGGQ